MYMYIRVQTCTSIVFFLILWFILFCWQGLLESLLDAFAPLFSSETERCVSKSHICMNDTACTCKCTCKRLLEVTCKCAQWRVHRVWPQFLHVSPCMGGSIMPPHTLYCIKALLADTLSKANLTKWLMCTFTKVWRLTNRPSVLKKKTSIRCNCTAITKIFYSSSVIPFPGKGLLLSLQTH